MNLTKLELSLLSVCFSSLPDPTGTISSIRFLIERECPFKTERSPFFIALLWVEISRGTWQVLRRPLQYIPKWSRWWLHILHLLASICTTSKNPIRKNLLALTKCTIIVIIIIIIQNIKVESKDFAFYFVILFLKLLKIIMIKSLFRLIQQSRFQYCDANFVRLRAWTLLYFVSFRFTLFIFPFKRQKKIDNWNCFCLTCGGTADRLQM